MANKGGFERVNPLGEGFIRGPARVLIAPFTASYPTTIGGVINLEEEASWVTEEQEIEKFNKEPTVGIFTLVFSSYETSELKYNASTEEVQKALEALPSIGTGGVKCTEGPLKEKGIKVEFAGELAKHAQPLILVGQNTLKKTAEVVTFTVIRKIAGKGQYDPVGEWTELGSTKGGIKITRNNTESGIDVDQIQAQLLSIPDEWEMTVEAPLAETSLANIQYIWEGAAIKTITTNIPNEQSLGLGVQSAYREKRMAVIHRKTVGVSAGKFRMHLMRRVTKSPQASSIDFMKTGAQSILPMTFKCYADPTISNPEESMGHIIDQLPYL